MPPRNKSACRISRNIEAQSDGVPRPWAEKSHALNSMCRLPDAPAMTRL